MRILTSNLSSVQIASDVGEMWLATAHVNSFTTNSHQNPLFNLDFD